MKPSALTPAAISALTNALARTSGVVLPLPNKLKGAAAGALLARLEDQGYIKTLSMYGELNYEVTNDGREALIAAGKDFI